MPIVHDFSVRDMQGVAVPLSDYRDQVLLIVNTASRCGFTPQYAGLEELYRQYKARGFAVLGFPCNQFGGQEPEAEDKIRAFCETKFGVTFPLFGKIEVNGAGADPLYRHLKSEQSGILGTEAIKWNFTKFLVDRAGRVVARFAPATKPEELAERIEALL